MMVDNTLIVGNMSAMKIAPKIKGRGIINLNNTVKSELPFTEGELLNILKIVDAALADEHIEQEVRDWMNALYEEVNFDELEGLHKKVNFFLQDKFKNAR
jgi:hypothetical protein